jgi:hypothetical protein
MTPQQHAAYKTMLAQAVVPEKHHCNIGEINKTITSLQVPEELKTQLAGVYAILAQAEATVHGVAVEQTHFHEVGNAKGIRNALAICAAFYALAPHSVTATAVQTGHGKIECAHGLMDIPAPATAAILENVPRAQPCLEGELCTPTSAAIIKYYVGKFVA